MPYSLKDYTPVPARQCIFLSQTGQGCASDREGPDQFGPLAGTGEDLLPLTSA